MRVHPGSEASQDQEVARAGSRGKLSLRWALSKVQTVAKQVSQPHPALHSSCWTTVCTGMGRPQPPYLILHRC